MDEGGCAFSGYWPWWLVLGVCLAVFAVQILEDVVERMMGWLEGLSGNE